MTTEQSKARMRWTEDDLRKLWREWPAVRHRDDQIREDYCAREFGRGVEAVHQAWLRIRHAGGIEKYLSDRLGVPNAPAWVPPIPHGVGPTTADQLHRHAEEEKCHRLNVAEAAVSNLIDRLDRLEERVERIARGAAAFAREVAE